MYTNPWEHIIQDNFYDKQSFFLMKKELNEYLKSARLTSSLTCIEDFSNLPNTLLCISKDHSYYNSFLHKFSYTRPYKSLSKRSRLERKFSYHICWYNE